ncbi:MAG: hypothetical protein ACRD1C_14725, partial [Terriglobales bacterium]
ALRRPLRKVASRRGATALNAPPARQDTRPVNHPLSHRLWQTPAWCVKLAVNDEDHGYYGAFLTPFQALELAGELAKMAATQMREYTEDAERELEALRKRAESEEW